MNYRIRALVFTMVVLMLLPGAASADTAWPLVGHDAGASSYAGNVSGFDARNASRLHVVWSHPGVITAVATGDTVYGFTVGGSAAHLVALNAANGHVLATATPGSIHFSRGDSFNALAYGNGRLIVAGFRDIVALGPGLGRVLWRVPFGATSLTIANGVVFTGEGCQGGCGIPQSAAISLTTGHVLWKHPGNFGGPPVVVGNRIYQVWGRGNAETRIYAAGGGTLLATLSLTGVWATDIRSTFVVSETPTVAGQTLSLVSPGGSVSWKLGLGRMGSATPPVLAPSTIYVASNRFHPGVIAVSRSTGRIVWGADLGDHLSLAGSSGLLFALHLDGKIDVLDARTGRILSKVASLRGAMAGSPGMLLSAGSLYVLSNAGVTALRT